MKFAALFSAVMALLAMCAPANAAPVAAGEAFLTDPSFRILSSNPGGTKIAERVSPFSGDNNFGGTLISEVYSGSPENPFGGLTFLYRIENSATNPNSIGRVTFSAFRELATDIQYYADARVGVIAPAQISRDPNGNVVGFNFFEQPAPASETVADFLSPGRGAVVLIHSPAQVYALTGRASFIDGGVASVASFGLVPEPSSFILLGLGAAAFVVRRWMVRR